MNDDFLHQMRVDPPAGFLAELKSRLDRQERDPVEVPASQQDPLRQASHTEVDGQAYDGVSGRSRDALVRTSSLWPRWHSMPAAPSRPSLVRMLLFSVLVGGSAFALASWSMSHLPTSILAWLTTQKTPATQSSPPKPAGHGWVWSGASVNGRAAAGRNGPAATGQIPWQFAEPPQNGTAPDAATRMSAAAEPGGRDANVGTGSAFVSAGGVALAGPRDYLVILDSPAAHPYTTAVLDHVRPGPNSKPPKVTVADSTTALAQLCAGTSYNFPDMATTSRRITPNEVYNCARTGVSITEGKLGVEGVVLARSELYGPLRLSSRNLFLALASQVPDPADPEALIRNPYTTWNQIDPALPADRIRFFGPVLSSSMGKTFAELLLATGCNSYPMIAALKNTDADRYNAICKTVRVDGTYGEFPDAPAAPTYFQRLAAEPTAVGLLKYAYEDRQPGLAVMPVDGILPTSETIASQTYPVARTLYIYVSNSHQFIPGLRQCFESYFWPGPHTPLTPPDTSERRAIWSNVVSLKPLRFQEERKSP